MNVEIEIEMRDLLEVLEVFLVIRMRETGRQGGKDKGKMSW